jgi:glucose-1-phosphate adenylyltransferase
MKKITAMILAGGKGERMDVLCHHRAKPILYFAGNHRIIDFTLSNCINSGITTIGIATGHDQFNVADYVSQWFVSNNQLSNLSILEPPDKIYRGTADAIYKNLEFIHKSKAELIVILAADHVYKMDYRKIISFHDEADADLTIGAVSVPVEEAYRFGTIVKNNENRVLNFAEKSLNPQSNLGSMGIYVFKREALEKILEADARLPDSSHDFGYSIIPEMVRDFRVFVYKFNNYWRDIGTIDAYYKTNMEYINQRQNIGLNSNWPVLTGDFKPGDDNYKQYLPGTGKNYSNSIISENCIIRGTVENSILSPGVCIDENAVVRNSILLPDTYVGYHSVVDNSILEENIDIGSFCYIGFDSHQGNTGRYIVLDRGMKIPPNTAVSHNGRMSLRNWDSRYTARSCSWGAVFSVADNVSADNMASSEALAVN